MSSQKSRRAVIAAAFVATLHAASLVASAQYEAPASYYASITNQTGAALKTQLTAIMATGHTQTNYGQARDYMPFTDANPDNLSQMFEFYTHVVIQKSSATQTGFIGIYNSREHVWPDSLQGPGDTSNGTQGSRGDIHMLKPLSSSVNGDRGNLAFGSATTTGAARNIGGGYWFPGMTDRGDAARIMFYAATRWGSNLSLVNGTPTTNTQMGDLDAILHFHYQDTPDLFELRRNDTIYRGDDVRTPTDDSAFNGTGNRNAYIDRPEYAWSVFVDNANDTRLSVGAIDANGASSTTVELGRVLRNAAVPAAKNVTVNKEGVDGTYYSVTTAGSATSTVTGRYNAFTMDTTGSRTFAVGLNTTTSTAGLKSGTVTIDNLDVTTGGGADRGANDGNDVINVQLAVLDAANPSFDAAADINSKSIDFGTYARGSAPVTTAITIANLNSSLGASLTARLDLDSVNGVGDVQKLSLAFPTFDALAAGSTQSSSLTLSTDTIGIFASTYSFSLSDEDLPGTQATSTLSLSVAARIALGGDTNYDGHVDFDDLLALAQNYGLAGASPAWEQGDFDRSGDVGFDDLLLLAQNYGSNASFDADWALAQAMTPEPILLSVATVIPFVRRRRRA